MKWYEIVGLISSILSIISAIFAGFSWFKSRKNKNETEKIRSEIFKKFHSLNDVKLMQEINLTIKNVNDRIFGLNKIRDNIGKEGFNDVHQLLSKIQSQIIYNNIDVANNVKKCKKLLTNKNLCDNDISKLTEYLSNISRIIDNQERSQ